MSLLSSAFLFPFSETTTMIWVVLTCTLLAYLYFTIKRKQQFWKKKGIKYIKPKFPMGNISIFESKSMADTTKAIYDAFPEERYHGIYQFMQPTLIVKDPGLIKQITVKEFNHFMDHPIYASGDVDPIWDKNLLASRGEKWRKMRYTLSPSFTSSKMRNMYGLIDECAQQFVEFFKAQGSGVQELEMKDILSRYANDVIATAAFGLKCDSLKNKTNEFYLMGKDGLDFSGLRRLKFFIYAISPTLSQLLKVRIIPSRVSDYFSRIISDTVKTREERNIIRPDMIHLLMEARKGSQHQEEESKMSEGFSSVSESALIKSAPKQEITMEDITAQAYAFFFAGFETVSTLLTFTFYELAVNPDIQDRLREEIEAVPGKVTYEALLSMKYLDMVLSEGLRKWPAAILTDRKVTKAFTIQAERPGEKPLHLEEGLVCWLPMFAVQRDPKYYSDPEKFDPERFNDENKRKINPATYFPFGAGPRNCIGSRFALLESKLIIFHVLKNFELVPVKKTPIPVVLDPQDFNLSAKGGMWLGLKKIN